MKSDDEWKKQLTPDQYRICRRKDTEAPFSGEYNDCKEEGTYQCVCCGNDLFSSETKYDSASGWPSFNAPINDVNVKQEFDNSLGMKRAEVLCSKCDAHLGHVFDDGPEPTGKRFCINSVSLKLVKRGKDLS